MPVIVVKWIMACSGPRRRLHGSNTRTLDAWHAGTGSKLWSFSADGLISMNIGLARGAVYFGSSHDYVYALSAPSQADRAGLPRLLPRRLLPASPGSPGKRGLFRPNGPWYPCGVPELVQSI